MTRTPIHTDKAPAVASPYSQAITANGLLFTSGTLPVDPRTGAIGEGSIEDHAHQVFRNLAAIAEAAGTSLNKAVKVTVLLTDIAHFSRVNAVYTGYFSTPYPARSAFQVAALPLNAAIEIEAIIAL